jgi:hypothetical protein
MSDTFTTGVVPLHRRTLERGSPGSMPLRRGFFLPTPHVNALHCRRGEMFCNAGGQHEP